AASGWFLRNREDALAFVVANERILFGSVTDKIAVRHPLRLHEFELPLQMRTDQEKYTAALSAIILENTRRQWRPVVRAAPQKVVEIDSDHLVLEGIAWIDTTNVRAEGALQSVHVLCVAERVVALRVTSQLRVVVLWREHQGGAAAPSADHLCRNQLLIRRGRGLRAQVSTKPGNIH